MISIIDQILAFMGITNPFQLIPIGLAWAMVFGLGFAMGRGSRESETDHAT